MLLSCSLYLNTFSWDCSLRGDSFPQMKVYIYILTNLRFIHDAVDVVQYIYQLYIFTIYTCQMP